MKVVSSDKGPDLPDGAVTDSILQVVLKNKPTFKKQHWFTQIARISTENKKTVLKKIKSLFNKQTDQGAEHTGEAEKTSEATRNGSEEHGQ